MEYTQLNMEMQSDQNRQEMNVQYSLNGKSHKVQKTHTKKRKSVLDLEEQMFKSEAHYTKSTLQSILESSIEYSIVGTDLNGTILVWNKGACRNYGYQADEMLHKNNILMLHTPEDIKSGVAQKFIKAALEQGKAEGTFERIRKDGSRFTASVTLTVRRDDEDIPIGYAMISRDITEAKRIENELIRSNEELEQFAYIASHDLKAPLRAIQRLACWIEEDNKDKLDEKSKENLALLRKRAIRLANLIDGILQYSRAGRMNLNTEVVDTKEILKDIVESLNPEGRFKINYPKKCPTFKAAKIPLIQVLSNLIGNSIKHHHRKNGTISIDVDVMGTFYLFTVKDDGPGIDPEFFDKIFVVFQTIQSRDELEATGIGLSIVKKIVESQGGKVMVQSQIGQGTTMSFTWPKYVN
ncbi:two-component sensor histidine kinase [Legionella gratiana]|uniref:histidine kinase n=1 Tax=Legionella gratiana TaxID=45066 RepID=A0A378JGG2_9GAMM|nr:ATP-binding protein [Legionella gratiana]KTD11960.1 two-component sensor histidine kinase [Legionella gratiana]STX46436.1 two-component sensor histidine kinase [Legionella gratiana]